MSKKEIVNDNTKGLSRRQALAAGTSLAFGFGANSILGASPVSAKSAADYTQWGWPKPYDPISPKSVDWLKSKGWWPLQVGWNPSWSDGNVTLFVMKQYNLLRERGIEAEFKAFQLAPLFNEVYIPGKIQVAQGSSLGVLRLIDLKIPTVAVATYSAQRLGLVAAPNSPFKSGLEELKGQALLKRPAIVGLPIGSILHQAFLSGVKLHGLKEGQDFVLKNAQLEDIITMPQGVDLFGIWEPNVIFMTEFLKNARVVEVLDKYLVSNGYSYMRGEIEQNAPDVVQAYADAFIEARLIAKLKTAEVLSAFAEDPSQRGRDPKLIERDAQVHVLDPKPTLNLPFINAHGFWAPLEETQSAILTDAGILKRKFTEKDFESILRPQYLSNTFQRLGWRVPERPAFLPANWAGKAGEPPYPPYGLAYMGKQPFPEKSDLATEWFFDGTRYTQ
jgi:ABC-type nitrate/sulfonate/bicarbonate transport system substrate-binding protein